jgi:hypothetical protein
MGWGRAGWYTARWVDRLLFPANGPSADVIVPELQDIKIGTFIPDGPPETKCGLHVEVLQLDRTLVLVEGVQRARPLGWGRARCPRSPRYGTSTVNGTVRTSPSAVRNWPHSRYRPASRKRKWKSSSGPNRLAGHGEDGPAALVVRLGVTVREGGGVGGHHDDVAGGGE